MTPLALFLYMVAFAGGLFCILGVVGFFWLLRLNVIARSPEMPTAENTVSSSKMPDPSTFPNSAAPRII